MNTQELIGAISRAIEESRQELTVNMRGKAPTVIIAHVQHRHNLLKASFQVPFIVFKPEMNLLYFRGFEVLFSLSVPEDKFKILYEL